MSTWFNLASASHIIYLSIYLSISLSLYIYIYIYIYPNRSIYFLAYFQDVNEGSASLTRVWQISSSNFYSDGVFISKKERDMYLNYLYYVVNQA